MNQQEGNLTSNQSNKQQGLWVFGNQLKGDDPVDENIVGEATWDGKDIIYKFAKFPNWRVWWEKSVSDKLQLLTNLKHFVKVLFVAQLPLKCNEIGHSEPLWVDVQRNEKWAMTDVLAYKKIDGITFEMGIRDNPSREYLLSGLYQALAIFDAAQCRLEFTHFDAHAGNMMMQMEKFIQPVIYLYNYGCPLAVPSINNYRVVFTDLEFSHVYGLDGGSMDSRLDLLCRAMDPAKMDKSYDSKSITDLKVLMC
jgi:hypothetical protein